jgi:hypothetical protein
MNSLLGALADNSLFDYYQATFNTTAPMQIFDIPFESGIHTLEYIYQRLVNVLCYDILGQ